MALEETLAALRALARPERLRENARVAIPADGLGVTIPELRALAKTLRPDHALALELWETGLHEARLLAGMVDDQELVTEAQLERWVGDFDSWDLCDGVCALFERTQFAWAKAVEWAGREEEFVRRAAFTLMAYFAVHDKAAADERFVALLPVI
ncbi:MAG: DNA alkylation repair protein, partial [Tepidiformaceae bacterium]